MIPKIAKIEDIRDGLQVIESGGEIFELFDIDQSRKQYRLRVINVGKSTHTYGRVFNDIAFSWVQGRTIYEPLVIQDSFTHLVVDKNLRLIGYATKDGIASLIKDVGPVRIFEIKEVRQEIKLEEI